MNKYILSIILTLTLCLSVKAQTSNVEIKVLTELENEPLFGATVYFQELERGEATNTEGIAKFSGIPNGTHEITISFLGFKTLETKITVPSNKPFIFELSEEGNELDAIVLQSTRSTRTVQKIPTRIEFIGTEELGHSSLGRKVVQLHGAINSKIDQ